MLLLIRWCKNGVTEIECAKELFLISNHNTKLISVIHQLSTATKINLLQVDNQKNQFQEHVEKKIHFNKTMNLTKQAIILQGEVVAIQINNEQLVSIDNVLNPAYHVRKGAPCKGCIKSAQENY
ncbi:16773_t:CDS:2 [Cetraspora pellucida]|uniref:16773_t:CDS:1 n=1 Tax=Cetraspora pellucida TaxID=1433469 RepID=A0ACA9M9J9_9GLOM|nr:16773_t:CDS:2 [Cetraspora pellucida]